MLTRPVTKRLGEEIARGATGLQHRRISAQFVIAEQADEGVLVHPDVPAGPAPSEGISAQIAIALLAADERLRYPIHQAPQRGMFTVSHGAAGCVEELAGVFPQPCSVKGARGVAMRKARQAGVLINVKQSPFDVDPHPIAEQAM